MKRVVYRVMMVSFLTTNFVLTGYPSWPIWQSPDPTPQSSAAMSGRPGFGHSALGNSALGRVAVDSTVPLTARPEKAMASRSVEKSAGRSVEKLSIGQIKAAVQAIQAAANRQDVDAILIHLAPNALVEGSTRLLSHNRIDHFRVNREAYRAKLAQGYRATTGYQGQILNLQVTLPPQGQTAVATFTLLELAELTGANARLSSTSQERISFKRVGARALVTHAAVQSQVSVIAR
jgi:hypothetical protein